MVPVNILIAVRGFGPAGWTHEVPLKVEFVVSY